MNRFEEIQRLLAHGPLSVELTSEELKILFRVAENAVDFCALGNFGQSEIALRHAVEEYIQHFTPRVKTDRLAEVLLVDIKAFMRIHFEGVQTLDYSGMEMAIERLFQEARSKR